MAANVLSLLSVTDRHTFQVGLLTKSWAASELMIDIAAAIVFGNLGANQRYKEMPRNLAQKLSMIRRVLTSHEAKLPPLSHCIRVVDCTSEGADFRHKCVHGVAVYNGNSFTLQYFDRFPVSIDHKVKKITEADLNDACAQAAFFIPAWSHVVPIVCQLAAIQLPTRLAVAPVPHPGLRPGATRIEKLLAQAIEGMDPP